MSKYIKLFDTHTEYQTYINGQDKILPNVSYCEDNNDVHYNPYVPMNIIIYEASTKLTETTVFNYNGLHTNAFNTTITSHTFNDGIGEIKFAENITSIGENAFLNCMNLTNITIPNSVTSIGDSAFNGCNKLISINIPEGITSISNFVFSGCTKLIEVIIPTNVTSIGSSAFYSCASLTSITIPNNVTTIGDSAFRNCSGLTNITSLATTAPTITSSTFRNIKTGGTLTVPTGSTGYDVWMGTGDYYLGKYSWTKIEQ